MASSTYFTASQAARRLGVSAKALRLYEKYGLLKLSSVGPDEAIIYCPANHGPPLGVRPHKGSTGFEAVEMCLGTPEVRARTQGVVAMRPNRAAISKL